MSLREELLAQGCVEKRNIRGTVYYENEKGDVIAKVCCGCNGLVRIEYYSKAKNGFRMTRSKCKKCMGKHYQENREKYLEKAYKWKEENRDRYLEKQRNHYKNNREMYVEKTRVWREENYERHLESCSRWQKENPDKVSLRNQRRRARKQMLQDNLTNEQQNAILAHFNNACALTGESTDLHLDHVIPLATGHGGTIYGNMIPLRGDLNCSKNDSNLFEWFESNRQRFNLSQAKFDALVKYLADVNEMTVDEYKAYYNGCFEDKAEESA
jgi:hypothetical protein